MKTFARLWSDDSGAILSAEYLFLMATCVCGVVVGMVELRNAVNELFFDTAACIRAMKPSAYLQIVPAVQPLGGAGGTKAAQRTPNPLNAAEMIP